MTSLLPQGLDKELVLPLARLYMLLHECFLGLHRLQPRTQHNLFEVFLLHLAEPLALLCEPL